ncbi:hypothetical protein J2Z31_001799 [Sinorhizobium kostiense]|uniref:Uncharacterized protein n=1 Tax=Sinorhizobium kostiense TaxID=76747 RepID=A0ABS4R0D2_9HYPH|nr:hypothetical protein [Sinorhizobium kostiense]MBP2235307.1 hypothetical protein [Sinorhizobium kostiense]
MFGQFVLYLRENDIDIEAAIECKGLRHLDHYVEPDGTATMEILPSRMTFGWGRLPRRLLAPLAVVLSTALAASQGGCAGGISRPFGRKIQMTVCASGEWREMAFAMRVRNKYEATRLTPSSRTVSTGSGTLYQATSRMPAGMWVMRAR